MKTFRYKLTFRSGKEWIHSVAAKNRAAAFQELNRWIGVMGYDVFLIERVSPQTAKKV